MKTSSAPPSCHCQWCYSTTTCLDCMSLMGLSHHPRGCCFMCTQGASACRNRLLQDSMAELVVFFDDDVHPLPPAAVLAGLGPHDDGLAAATHPAATVSASSISSRGGLDGPCTVPQRRGTVEAYVDAFRSSPQVRARAAVLAGRVSKVFVATTTAPPPLRPLSWLGCGLSLYHGLAVVQGLVLAFGCFKQTNYAVLLVTCALPCRGTAPPQWTPPPPLLVPERRTLPLRAPASCRTCRASGPALSTSATSRTSGRRPWPCRWWAAQSRCCGWPWQLE